MPYFCDNHMDSVDPDLKDLQKTVDCYTDYRMEGTNRPSIIWVLFDDHRIDRSAREKYRTLYNSSIQNYSRNISVKLLSKYLQ